MNRVELRSNGLDSTALIGQGVPDVAYVPVASPVMAFDADTGELLFAVTRYSGDLGALRRAIMAYPMGTVPRAVGTRNVSGTFGYLDRSEMMRRYGCRSCAGATEAPDAHSILMNAGGVLFGQFMGLNEHGNAGAGLLLAEEKIRPEWRIPKTPWTSGIINRTSPLPYHLDRNNLPIWNAMVVIRRQMQGGFFHVPEYGVALECRDGDACFFPAYRVVHGVTPMRPKAKTGYRYSAVWYSVAGMAGCLEPAAELERARQTRSTAEDDALERQTEAGLLGG
jgi:hypothetical protein